MGWFRNLLNRITGKNRALEEGQSMPYNVMSSNMDKYVVDQASLESVGMGKSDKEIALERAVATAAQGLYASDLNATFPMLSKNELQACINIAYTKGLNLNDVREVGGIGAVVGKMVEKAVKEAKEYGMTDSEAYKFIRNSNETVKEMVEEKRLIDYKESFRLKNPDRVPYLNQLVNSAILMAKSGQTISGEDLVNFASRRGGYPIVVGGENPVVENVDLEGAISIGYAVAGGNLKEEDIVEVGGGSKLLDEMSTSAKMDAKQAGFLDASQFLKHPTEVISTMPKEEERQETRD